MVLVPQFQIPVLIFDALKDDAEFELTNRLVESRSSPSSLAI
jgi:hypothetical protein